MACNKCSSKVTILEEESEQPELPSSFITVDDFNNLNSCTEVELIKECTDVENPDSTPASPPEGKCLDSTWLNAVETKCATLLARSGSRLAKITGTGVLWIDKGVAYVRNEIPLKVSRLYHKWITATPTADPTVGQPLPFDYQVIADKDGNTFVVKGLMGEDSITTWDHVTGKFYQKPVSDFPTCVTSKLSSAMQLEMVGFEPLGIGDDPSMVRCLKRIQGEGIIVFKTIDTAPTDICDCEDCEATGQQADTTTIAEFIPNPEEECVEGCPWLLGYDATTKTHKYYDASQVDCLKGATGEQGEQGERGEKGDPINPTCC